MGRAKVHAEGRKQAGVGGSGAWSENPRRMKCPFCERRVVTAPKTERLKAQHDFLHSCWQYCCSSQENLDTKTSHFCPKCQMLVAVVKRVYSQARHQFDQEVIEYCK